MGQIVTSLLKVTRFYLKMSNKQILISINYLMFGPKNQVLKSDYCYYCYLTISAPINESVVKCRNCKKMNVFLCHIVNPGENLSDIICLKCSNNFILLTCPSCKGFQGFNKTLNNFKNGMKHQCQCSYISTLIYCNNCQFLISIKGKHSHQLAQIKCKNCQHQFKHKICQSCGILTYKQRWDMSQVFICVNGSCPKSQVSNPYEMGNNQHYLNRLSEFQQQQKQNSLGRLKEISEKELCKICLNQEANMINTKCYHLAACQKCTSKLKKCPICRAQGGQFIKIYKA